MNQIKEIYAIYRDNGEEWEDHHNNIMENFVFADLEKATAVLKQMQDYVFVPSTKQEFETMGEEGWESYEEFIEYEQEHHNRYENIATYSLVTFPVQH